MNVMVMSTYLNFDGTCADAFRYYEEHLGGTIDSMTTFGEMPDHSQVDPAWTDRIVHGRMTLGGMALMGADIQGAEPVRSAYLTIDPETIEDAERIFAALSDRGEVFMPLQEAFFATRFAQLRDRFGINWMILLERATATAN